MSIRTVARLLSLSKGRTVARLLSLSKGRTVARLLSLPKHRALAAYPGRLSPHSGLDPESPRNHSPNHSPHRIQHQIRDLEHPQAEDQLEALDA